MIKKELSDRLKDLLAEANDFLSDNKSDQAIGNLISVVSVILEDLEGEAIE